MSSDELRYERDTAMIAEAANLRVTIRDLEAALAEAREANAKMAEALEPFANLNGRFPNTVLVEICHPCPENPSPRIEPFLVRHIIRAAEALAHRLATKEQKDG